MTTTYASRTLKPADKARLADLDHYSFAAYASIEQHTQTVVIVDPNVTEPTFLLAPGTRKVSRRNIVAVAVPSLDAIDRPLAIAITHVAASFFGLRSWPADMRQRGDRNVHAMPVVAGEFCRG